MAQELQKLKEEPGEGETVADLAATLCKHGVPAASQGQPAWLARCKRPHFWILDILIEM